MARHIRLVSTTFFLLAAVGCGPSHQAPVFDAGDGGIGANSDMGADDGALADAQPDATLDPLSLPRGTWYLNADGARLTLVLQTQNGVLGGWVTSEADGSTVAVESVQWDGLASQLLLRRAVDSSSEWFRATIVEGVMVGRRAPGAGTSPPQLSAYSGHVTGWKQEYFDGAAPVPRAFELLIDGESRARLRIDRSADGRGLSGQFKIYASVSSGALDEQLASDVDVQTWDGAQLVFVRHLPGADELYTGRINGRTIAGTVTQAGTAGRPFAGARSEVLTHGLTPLGGTERDSWQQRTRLELAQLLMAGNPAPLTMQVTTLAAGLSPQSAATLPPDRDDNPIAWPQDYTVSELVFEYSLPNPSGGMPLTRHTHGMLAVPTTPPRPAGYPAVLAVNGHEGSAHRLLDPGDVFYWYGDAFARRGYVVLALDIGHRPVADRRGLYDDYEYGDDPDFGNGPHPAIAASGMDSDWEEEGERVWDVLRAHDHLRSLPMVDSTRVLVTGLSLGGEVATLVGALDPRVAVTVAAGFSPDLGVMLNHGNHACWQWLNADAREYVDVSDYHALAAPRMLVVETGIIDDTFSYRSPPFAADKEVLRRSRLAYFAEQQSVLHYLHYDQHHYHAGDVDTQGNPATGLCAPLRVAPSVPGETDWEADASTTCTPATTLFDRLAAPMP